MIAVFLIPRSYFTDLMSDTFVGDKLDTSHILRNLESEDANLSFQDAELGDLFGDAVMSWGDGTCLDSFVDLSQFLDIQVRMWC